MKTEVKLTMSNSAAPFNPGHEQVTIELRGNMELVKFVVTALNELAKDNSLEIR